MREDRDIKQQELAEILYCTQQTYSNYENGNREISYKMIIKLAEFYNTSTDCILGLTDNPNKP